MCRSNPLPDENPEDLAFAGDNFARHSGDSLHLAQSQVHDATATAILWCEVLRDGGVVVW